DDARRRAERDRVRRNIAGDDAAGTDDGAIADRDAALDEAADADIRLVSDRGVVLYGVDVRRAVLLVRREPREGRQLIHVRHVLRPREGERVRAEPIHRMLGRADDRRLADLRIAAE